MSQQGRRVHCAQTKRLGMCLFARANLTHRCLLKAPRFPYCLPLVQNSSPSVQVSSSPLIASATLHHFPTWQQNMFVTFLSLWVPHSSSSSCQVFLLSHHHYCRGFFIGVTGKLWAWCLHFNFELWFTPIFSIIIDTGNHLSYYSSPPSYHLNHHHQKGQIAHRHNWVVVLKMVLEHSFCKN